MLPCFEICNKLNKQGIHNERSITKKPVIDQTLTSTSVKKIVFRGMGE